MYLGRLPIDNRKNILIGILTFLRPEGRPAGRRPARWGPDLTSFSEPDPYKTCRFLGILAKMGPKKRPGRCVDPSRDRAPRLIRKKLFESKKVF